MRIELYHFEYMDTLRKRWLRARYVATREEIARRHPQHRLIGEPEIRDAPDDPTFSTRHKMGGDIEGGR